MSHFSQGEYSGFQVTGMIEWGQNQNPKKSLDKNLAPKISHAEFPTAKGNSSAYIKSLVINGDNNNNKKRIERWFTSRDTLQTIDMIDCILTGFMKKMQCNVLNIKTAAKQVWVYFIRGTTGSG